MSLEVKITNDLKEAMKNKDQAALRSVRAIKAAILLFKTDGSGNALDETAEIKSCKNWSNNVRILWIFTLNKEEKIWQ